MLRKINNATRCGGPQVLSQQWEAKDGQEFDVSLVYRGSSSLKKHNGVINTALSLVFLSFGSCLKKKKKNKHFPPT